MRALNGSSYVNEQATSGPDVDSGEITVMTVWPTIAATRPGRWLGRLYGMNVGISRFLPLGRFWMFVTIPVALVLFCWLFMPWLCRRYRLTNRRLVIQKGLSAVDGPSVALDAFDAIEVAVLPGQEWFPAGDLVFLRDGCEVFRVRGVGRPDIFRRTCLKTQQALLSVGKALAREKACATAAE